MFYGDLDETRKMQRCWRHERPVPDIYTSAYKVLFAGSVKFDLGRVRCGALKYVYWIAPMRS